MPGVPLIFVYSVAEMLFLFLSSSPVFITIFTHYYFLAVHYFYCNFMLLKPINNKNVMVSSEITVALTTAH